MKNGLDELGAQILNSESVARASQKRKAGVKMRKPKGVKVTVEVSHLELSQTGLTISPSFRVYLGTAIREHLRETCTTEWIKKQYVAHLRRIEEQRRAAFELQMQALRSRAKSTKPQTAPTEPKSPAAPSEVQAEASGAPQQAPEALESQKADVHTFQAGKQ